MPFRPSAETRRQLKSLRALYGTNQTVITMAVDRMFQQERSAMSENRLYALAADIYSALYGHLDNKYFEAAKVGEIADWLAAGDGGEGRTVADLAAEWRDLDSEDVLANADINIEVLEDSDRVLDIEAATGLDGFWDRSPWWEFAHDGVYVDCAATQAEYTEEVYFALRKRWPEARILLHEQDTLPGSEHGLLVNGSVDHDLAYYVQSEIDQVFGRLGELTVLHHYSVEPCPAAELVALHDQVLEVMERYGGEIEAARLHIDRQPEPIEILHVHAIGRAGIVDGPTEIWLEALDAEDAARHYLGAGIGG